MLEQELMNYYHIRPTVSDQFVGESEIKTIFLSTLNVCVSPNVVLWDSLYDIAL